MSEVELNVIRDRAARQWYLYDTDAEMDVLALLQHVDELEARVKALAVERDEAVMSTQKDIRAHLRTVIKAECSAGLDRKNDIWDSGYYSGMHKMLAEVTHWMRSKMAKEVTP